MRDPFREEQGHGGIRIHQIRQCTGIAALHLGIRMLQSGMRHGGRKRALLEHRVEMLRPIGIMTEPEQGRVHEPVPFQRTGAETLHLHMNALVDPTGDHAHEAHLGGHQAQFFREQLQVFGAYAADRCRGEQDLALPTEYLLAPEAYDDGPGHRGRSSDPHGIAETIRLEPMQAALS